MSSKFEIVDDDELDLTPPKHRPDVSRMRDPQEGWIPDLGTVGLEIFNSTAAYNLVHAERFSGKSIAVLHKLTRHVYDYPNAIAVISALTRSQAQIGGVWGKLTDIVLPHWVEGIGLSGEGAKGQIHPRQDDVRNRIVWIANRYGGWSLIVLRTMLYADQIQGRLRGMEYTFFMFDELQTTGPEDDVYFTKPIQQLYRRSDVPLQQYFATTNPADEGEEHWVWKRFLDPEKKLQSNPSDYKSFYLPFSENRWITKYQRKQYIEILKEEGRGDPTADDRNIHGLWVARPKGGGLFNGFYMETVHVIGTKKRRLLPLEKLPMIYVGYDMGPRNTSISFEQRIPIEKGAGDLWTIFDEIVLISENVPLRQKVLMLLAKMNFWCKHMDVAFSFLHISDNQAFNQKDNDGSYEFRKVLNISKELLLKDRQNGSPKYPALTHIRQVQMKPAPKPQGSVSSRVIALQSLLIADAGLRVSATCEHHIRMLRNLQENPDKLGHPLKTKSGEIHVFDSCTYPIYATEMGMRVSTIKNKKTSPSYTRLAI